jgi:hypothetical protein
MVNDMTRISVALFIALHALVATAAEMPDPTRPPASLISGVDTDSAAGQKPVESQSGLQTTIISPPRCAAIIDGKTVELGEMHGDMRLVEVSEGGVVLQNAQKRRVLTLFPDLKISQRDVVGTKVLPKSKVQPDKAGTKPAEQYEKHLSVRPKEKK